MKLLFIIAALATIPAYATTVYIEGTLATGGSLSGGSFWGTFDIGFPVSTNSISLNAYDVFLTGPGGSVELKNGIANDYGASYGSYESSFGALAIEFGNSSAGDLLALYFTVPFTGNAPVVLHTTGGYPADANLNHGSYTNVKQGLASLTPLPEPSTWMLMLMGAAIVLGVRAVRGKLSPCSRAPR